MIGWRVDYGYCLSKDPTSINDFVFTDRNSVWCLPLIKNFDAIISTGQNPGNNGTEFSDMQEGYSLLDSFLGEDSKFLFADFAESNVDPATEKLLQLFPTYDNAYPNLLKYAINNDKNSSFMTYYAFTYFHKKKCFITGYGVWELSSDGTIEKVSNLAGTGGMGAIFRRNFIDSRGYFLCALSSERENLLDYNNFYMIQSKWYKKSTILPWVGFLSKAKADATQSNVNIIRYFFSIENEPDFSGGEIPPDNPYDPGGPSGPTDPDLPPGTFDDESDIIPDSPLPTLSAANTGFTRIYNPTLSQVQALARYLWTDETVIETIWNHIKQFFENPMDAIIGFNLVPVPVPDGGTQNFALMYIDTGVQMTVAANQFVDLDCGTLELKRYYGSALDQSPYTKVSCFLPYIGTVNLNTDEVMGTTLNVKYRVDIVSGSCVAKIFVDGNCLYQYSGHCAITIPFSSADFSSYVSAAISVGKLAAAAITAGAGAAMAAGVAEASQQTNQVVTTTQVTNTARNPSTGRQITTGTTTTVQTRESPADQSSTQASFSGLSPQNIANTVGAIMSSKPHIEHSGSFSGNSGYLGVRRPFLIIERPNMCMPENYQALNGFPAMITMELSTCKGFTRVQQVQLTGMGRATNPEQAEILELLKSGVIL